MNSDIEPKAVIELYETLYPHADAKAISETLGFDNHREMAEFMLNQGFVWDCKKFNYFEEKDLNQLAQVGVDSRIISISEYMPMLKWLKTNEVGLMELLDVELSEEVLSGDNISRKIEISKKLDLLLMKYCKTNQLRPSKVLTLALDRFFEIPIEEQH